MAKDIEGLQHIELALWEQLKDQDWLANLANKLSEMRWLLPRFAEYTQLFGKAQSILELGAGDGWASCVAKRLYPDAWVIASDISEAAISGIGKWERIFESSVDARLACKSYAVPLPDGSIDVIFTFQAAHHFLLQVESLEEVARLLKPGGVCLYMNEPSCQQLIHPIAKWRVNAKRPECPEDVLVVQEMRKAAAKFDLTFDILYKPETVNRGVIEGVYYKVLSTLPALCRWLPCTADFIFTKR